MRPDCLEAGTRVLVLRTVVVTLSPLLRELLTSVLSPEIVVDVIEVLATRERVVERLRELGPDLVLIGLLDSDADAVVSLLLPALPSVRILVLASNGEHAWLYESGRFLKLSNVSVAALKEALQNPISYLPD
jgi:DNA-binding NarL/FixJ family response regulator